MIRFILTVLVISFVQLVTAQQQIIFSESKPESFLVKYNSSADKTVENFIIKNIATGSNKPLQATKFTFSYNQASQIIKKNGILEFLVELNDVHFNGDISYKNIFVDDVLFPAKVNFDLKLYNAANQLLKTFEFDDASIDWNSNNLVNITEKDTFGTTDYRFEIVNKNYVYNNLNQKFFKNKIELIDEYYTLGKQIEIGFLELQSINLENLDFMYDYQHTIEKNELLIKTINDKDFYNQLALSKNDPINLDENISNLYDFNIQLKHSVNEIISHIYEYYFKKGMDFMLMGNHSMAEIYFNKSVNTNIRFAPAHFQLAKLRYLEKNYDASVLGLKNIINNMNADPQTVAFSIELAEKIQSDYINIGIRHYENSDYELALNSLDKAKDICITVRGVNCSEQLNKTYSNTINAKLKKYLLDADMMVKKDLLADAENELQKAKFFYQNNQSYFQSDADLLSGLNSLFVAYLNKGKMQIDSKAFTEALASFEKAKQLCIENNSLNCNDEVNNGILSAKNGVYEAKLNDAEILITEKKSNLAENKLNDAESFQKLNSLTISNRFNNIRIKLKQLQYAEIIGKAKELNLQNNTEAALKALDEAILIESEFAIKKDTQLPKLIEEFVSNVVISNINLGEEFVNQNKLSAARQNYENAQRYMSNYRQESNSKLNSLLASLHEKIFSQECKNHQSTYNQQFGVVLNLIEKQKYIEADDAISKTIQISEKYPECYMSTKEVNNKRSEILPAITYQRLQKNINDEISKGNYKEAIDKYNESEAYFYQNNVGNFNLTHLATIDFIKSQGQSFVHFAVEEYTKNKDFDNALLFLSELKSRNYSSKWARIIQENLAVELAKKDLITRSNEDGKQVVAKYTNNDKWYKYFSKAYLKQWKGL